MGVADVMQPQQGGLGSSAEEWESAHDPVLRGEARKREQLLVAVWGFRSFPIVIRLRRFF